MIAKEFEHFIIYFNVLFKKIRITVNNSKYEQISLIFVVSLELLISTELISNTGTHTNSVVCNNSSLTELSGHTEGTE